MELNLLKFNMQELSANEKTLINGGGPWWFWLGTMFKKFEIICNEIQEANIEAPVSVAEWN